MKSAAGELPIIDLHSSSDPLDQGVRAKLSALLPEYVASRRWYRAKAKTIASAEVEDVLPLPSTGAYLLVVSIQHTDGASDRYLLPVLVASTAAGAPEEAIARLVDVTGNAQVLSSALDDATFRDALLQTIICETKLTGDAGSFVASHTSQLSEECREVPLRVESFVSRAEQSNTSIIYRERYILKLFRKLEEGVNPDVEIGKFLTARGFRNTPAVLGSLEYRAQGAVCGAGILQQFVPNQGDAWKYTLESLEGFFAKALASRTVAPTLESEHPMELIGQTIPASLRSFIGSYLESASLLGKRTAEMHAALTDVDGGADFVPEPFTAEDRRALQVDLTEQADIAFELLRRKQAGLTGATAQAAHQLLHHEERIGELFAGIESHPIEAVRIRHHGDYHLGQVLYTGQDFMIIDFEGEPARPLAARRAKALALRDVAGMVRSFQYAAFAALFGQVPGVPTATEILPVIEAWASSWTAYVSAAYLKAYFDESKGQAFVPAEDSQRRLLLDAFLLQKAFYEVAYELNNRPDWLQIPLRGILSLIG